MTRSLPHPKQECERSVNDFRSCILNNAEGCAATSTHNRTIGRSYRQKCFILHRTYALIMGVNGASMILCLPSPIIKGLCSDIDP